MTRHAIVVVGSGSGGGHASSQTNSPEPQPRTDEPRLRTDQHGDAGSQRYSSSVTSSSTRRESSHACRNWTLSTSAADGNDTRRHYVDTALPETNIDRQVGGRHTYGPSHTTEMV